jgi:hypothetical protein
LDDPELGYIMGYQGSHLPTLHPNLHFIHFIIQVDAHPQLKSSTSWLVLVLASQLPKIIWGLF